MSFIVLAMLLSYVVPTGEFVRQTDAATGRSVVVPGSYHAVPATPVSPLAMLVDVPKGMLDAGAVIFLIFLAGGAFTVVDQTGALRFGVDWLMRKLRGRENLIIPLVAILFATMGALENMGEEIIPLVPVLLLLMRRMGYPPLTAVAASAGAAFVGASFSPINPFQVGIAQKLAQLPLLSGGGYRLVFLALALTLWIVGVLRHANRNRVVPAGVGESGPTATGTAPEPAAAAGPASAALAFSGADRHLGEADSADSSVAADSAAAAAPAAQAEAYATTTAATAAAGAPARHGLVLALLLGTFAVFAYGVLELHWDFEQMAALFLALGIVAGLAGGLGLTGTAEGFVTGFRDVAFSAMVVGFARAIFVVLEQGHIVDTIVRALAEPLARLPVTLAALGMVAVQTALHVPVPSGSGQATLTMPLLVPLSDLIGLSRQVTVLAFQYGAGLCELITPTNGTLVAMLAATGVRFEQWLKFVWPLYLGLLALGIVSVVLGIALGV